MSTSKIFDNKEGILRIYTYQGGQRTSRHVKAANGTWYAAEFNSHVAAMFTDKEFTETEAHVCSVKGSPLLLYGESCDLPQFGYNIRCNYALTLLDAEQNVIGAVFYKNPQGQQIPFLASVEKEYETVRFSEAVTICDPEAIAEGDYENCVDVKLDPAEEYRNLVLDFDGFGLCALIQKKIPKEDYLSLFFQSFARFVIHAQTALGIFQDQAKALEMDSEKIINDLFSRSVAIAQTYGVAFNTQDLCVVRTVEEDGVVKAIFVLTSDDVSDIAEIEETAISLQSVMQSSGENEILIEDEDENEDEEDKIDLQDGPTTANDDSVEL